MCLSVLLHILTCTIRSTFRNSQYILIFLILSIVAGVQRDFASFNVVQRIVVHYVVILNLWTFLYILAFQIVQHRSSLS